ncbi:UDP-N-acetylmuramate--L-alanine ligase [Chondromyces crocatus]|uniref:UDP-N-acetylmuramate:L-alanyl-gamma-D-glutamyl-meso-diaminopimelate ligase n=1 Tax=Chondromyces crocatus TaxID=52 RepID=A0A0K1E604_CHOCO|nr:Mur ligase family protein [Chondromyces crocatus]AKT36305.1 UDP-N-acetylmuramate:L-alanyl-gamma-D-glutamyl- meso-diaminopimelate ligase [Chondromyces crocatus]
MHVHFIGVAGSGMGALAGLFKAAGHDVSGSDVAFHPPMGPALERWGIRLLPGFDAAHLDPRPDLVVVGNVCRPNNPEARAAIDAGLPTTTMAHALAEHLLRGRTPLVVAGTHGKTTTSALCAWLLHQGGRDPAFLIGGLPKNFDASFRLSQSTSNRGLQLALGQGGAVRANPFVIEGDEYDTAFFEKTPKFWHYRPQVGIITSIEHDHIDIYPDESSYLAAFRGFVERIPEGGLIIAAAHDRHVVETVSSTARAPIAWFALEGDDTHGMPPHWLAAPSGADSAGQSFDLFAGGVFAGRFGLKIPGLHNVRNAVAALAAAAQGFGIPLGTLGPALPQFEGVRRRQDLVFEVDGLRVYDDFAHHPTAVDETLKGLRTKHASGRLWAVFEPRSATACRGLHQQAYEHAFDAADRIVLAPLGRSDIPADEQLDRPRLAAALKSRGKDADAATSIDAIVDSIARDALPGDTIALLSNGSFGGIHEKLRARLAKKQDEG